MQILNERLYSLVSRIIQNGILPNLKEESNASYTLDPVFGIVRNRVNAEICKSLLRINSEDSHIPKIINYIIECQNEDGSWNEIHPNYNQPSALVTSFIGEALVKAFKSYPDKKRISRSLEKAKEYVLSQEQKPGYFVKSLHYTADHPNVDASCGAFLAEYADEFSDCECLEAAKRAARRVCESQIDGSFPYTTDKGSYEYSLDVPCVHYQGVTIYYLAKINDVLHEGFIKESLLSSAEWLSLAQKDGGRLDWAKSGLMFAYYLTGAYAFAYSSFVYVSRWDIRYLKNAELCLDILEKNIDGLAFRWEKQSWVSLPASISTTLKTAFIGDYPLNHRLFRFGYGMYRQIATRGFSDNPLDDRVFKTLVKLLGLNHSVIEASKNFHDLFMTSEILDCLSLSLEWRNHCEG